MKFKHYFKATMLLTALGAFTSCQDNLLESGYDGIQLDENGLTTITLNVTTEDVLATRGENGSEYEKDPTQEGVTISKGTNIDKLIYAVYMQVATDEEGTDSAFVLKDYFASNEEGTAAEPGVSEDPSVEEDEPTPPASENTEAGKAGKGQIVVNNFDADETFHIQLKVDPDSVYKIVCWAQDGDCEAYTTTNLEQVEVSYENANNNDETRDAFCGAKEFKGDTKSVKVVLRRPFAQINVGTTGADYDRISKIQGGTHYTFSKMIISGLANQFNVLTNVAKSVSKTNGEAAGAAESSTKISATFDWAALPAWINIEDPDELEASNETYGDGKTFSGDPLVWAKDEEFLLVDLDNDREIKGYLPEYSTKKTTKDENGTEKTEYLTETFKYMSMSYVLVPSTERSDGTFDSENPSASGNQLQHSSTIDVTVYFNNQAADSPEKPTATKSKLTLTNVPAARNWRTNILGGFWEKPDTEDPDDPDPTPDDPSSIFSDTHIDVVVVTNYFGNSNTTNWSGKNWENSDNEYSPTDGQVKTGHEDEQSSESSGSTGQTSRSKK